MLVLSRRMNESIVLPDLGVTITVVAIRGTGARLSFDAPPGVIIHREEIWNRVQQEDRMSAEKREQTSTRAR